MAGPNPVTIKTFKAEGTIDKYNIVKFGAADDGALEASAATDLVIGVALEAAVSGGRVDVVCLGIATVKAGGTITRGQLVTATASGTAAAAAPGAGVNNPVLGRAMASAVSGDEFPVMVNPSVMQG